ncbi:glycine receptor subunit alpha-1-like isoform X2 [Ptychodera flava]|uniref:glycine receptor subunit alpha-1-like isoform X2 n=1 Tax=Ptychodera flava TaxID=63121 RepID=UPI003969C4DE
MTSDRTPAQYSSILYIDLYWNDPRYKTTSVNNTSGHFPSLVDKIWKPDVYFLGSKSEEIQGLVQKSQRLSISSNGDISYSFRSSLTMACNMDFTLYPFDRQICEMTINSFSYTVEDVVLHWHGGKDGVRLSYSTHAPQFTFEDHAVNGSLLSLESNKWSILTARFAFVRRIEFFLLTHFLTSSLKCLTSILNFWLPLPAAPARVAMPLTCLMTLTIQLANIKSDLPPLAYPTAMEIWIIICMIFSFACLGAYAVALNMGKASVRRKLEQKHTTALQGDGKEGDIKFISRGDFQLRKPDRQEVDRRPSTQGAENFHINGTFKAREDDQPSDLEVLRTVKKSQKVDGICRVLFPVSFVVVLVSYWFAFAYYLQNIATDQNNRLLRFVSEE